MKRWGMAILVVVLVAIAAAASAMPAAAQEQEVTAIAPGGNYRIYVTAKKPAWMSLSGSWEIRFYIYSGSSCFNKAPSGQDGGWWLPTGSTTWLYSGWYDYRIKNNTWTANEMTWSSTVSVIHYPASTTPEDREMRYPPSQGENYPEKMSEIGSTVNIRARFLFRDVSTPTVDGEYITFKIGTNTFKYKFTKPYDDYELEGTDGANIGTLSQSEGTGEWRLQFDQTVYNFSVDNTAPTSGKITIQGIIDFSGLSPVGLSIPIWVILAGGVLIAAVIAIVFIMRRRKGEEIPLVPEFAPPPPPEAPPAPPEAPPPTGSATATS